MGQNGRISEFAASQIPMYALRSLLTTPIPTFSLTGYERWWSEIYQHMASRGDEIVTTTPEFGPKSYAWSHAYTGETLNNIWSVNHFIGQRMSVIFTKVFGSGAAVLVDDPEQGIWPDIK